MANDFYILEGKETIPVDHLTWVKWFVIADNLIIARASFGEILISTVFLGVNHQWNPDLPPLIFETKFFSGKYNGKQIRYPTYDEAFEGHRQCLRLVKIPDILDAEILI